VWPKNLTVCLETELSGNLNYASGDNCALSGDIRAGARGDSRRMLG
jgi:hypothetical protein